MREGGAPAAGWRWLLSKQRVLRRACPALPTAASSHQLPPLCRLMECALENDLPHWRVDGTGAGSGWVLHPPGTPFPGTGGAAAARAAARGGVPATPACSQAALTRSQNMPAAARMSRCTAPKGPPLAACSSSSERSSCRGMAGGVTGPDLRPDAEK